MTPEEKEEFKELVSTATTSAVEKKIEKFFVPPEEHYLDHLFVKNVREKVDTVSNASWKILITSFWLGIIGIFVLGIKFWGKLNLK